MAKITTADIRRAILKELPKDGSSVGNKRMRHAVATQLGVQQVNEDDYFRTCEALMEDGKVVMGKRGRGGSVARVRVNDLRVVNLGPVHDADIEFGDLTVIVGPQATGKSVLLETLKLVIDRDHIHQTFARNNTIFTTGADATAAFLGGYFGKGMGALNSPETRIEWGGRPQRMADLSKSPKRAKTPPVERVFYIPAQRVVSLPKGVSQNFSNFDYGDPYVLRHFSDTVHNLLQNEFGTQTGLFPRVGRLNDTLRKPIAQHFFGGAKLEIDAREFTKRLILKIPGSDEGLPFLAWSAGQREFIPLLLGLYWLCPGGATPRREKLEWVVIEEPEMGLHPLAISSLLLLVLELMRRDYRVVISTHSPVVLEMVWTLRQLQELAGTERDVRKLFALHHATTDAKNLAQTALDKYYRVYFFERDKPARDISKLDPGSDLEAESEWGGLTGFSSRAGNVVARAVNRYDAARAYEAKGDQVIDTSETQDAE
jgi:hypothetical protein